MVMTMKYRYRTDDEMKDSGVEWLGKIPKEWEVNKIKHYFIDVVEKNYSEDVELLSLYTHIGVKPQKDLEARGNKAQTVIEYNKVKPGDIVVNKMLAWMGAMALSEYEGVISPAYNIYRKINQEINTKYYHYLFRTKRFANECYKNGWGIMLMRWTTTPERFKNIFIPFSLQEQQKIALFLDKKTAEFDSIIEKKQSFITKLTEAKKSLISEVVTGKVKVQVIDNKYQVISRTDDEMKDSGVEWLGKIPKEWEVKRLKHYIKDLESGVSVNASESESAIENEIGVLKTSCVVNYTFNAHENKKVLENEINRVNCPVKKGMIIISRMNTPELVGASGYVEEDYPNLFLPDRLWQTIFNKENIINIRLLSYILLSERFKNSITTIATGTSSSMKNISKGNFLNLSISVSNLQEQQLIVDFLDEKTAKIDSTIEKIKLQIEKLKEAKQSLISEAVTGKIEVI